MLNFNEDNNFIIINEKAFVPGKGKGPFVKPFRASGSQIRLFRRLGLHVTIVDEDYVYPSDKSNKKEDKNEKVSESNDTQSQEKQSNDESSNEVKEEETKEETSTIDEKVDEKVEEKVDEKVEEQDSEKAEVTEEELNEFTVAELKEELESKEIEYNKNARKQDLIDLLLEK